MSTKKYLSYDGLAEYDVLIKSDIDKKVSNKQDKTIVVTKGSDNLASHTPSEILEYSKAGANAVYFDGGTYHAFLEGDASGAIFYSSYIDNNKIQFTIVQIFADKTVSYSRSSYNPPVTSVNNKTGKISLTASDVGADSVGSAAQSLEEAKSYADNAATTVKNELLNGAGEAYDTLKELGDLITENVDAIDALEIVATSKADKEHTHTYESIEGLEDVINNVADSKFYVVTFDKGEDNEYHGDLTFTEIREKFEAGGNMVARIDGTDYIPLLSAAPHQIIFSGIYQSQSVSLTINSSDVCTLTTTSLTSSNNLHAHTSNYNNPHKVSCGQIGAATVNDLNTLQDNLNTLNDELTDLISSKADSTNAVLEGTLGLNHAGELGFASVSLGFANDASGMYCFSEGMGNKSTGNASHTEGTGNTASADAAHAEGYGTEASNVGAHAEGANTKATGYGSHAEGSGTIASGEGQHVEGKYNIENTTFVHIIGNGTSASKRSNAHTLDWNGNAEYAGDVVAYGCSGTSPISLSEVSANVDILSDAIGEGYEVISNEELDLLFV